MSASVPGLTAILARAADKSREALAVAEDEAVAWLEEIRSGARSNDKDCVVCERGPAEQDNHVARRRHGALTVPMCVPCHQRLTEEQDLWDPRSTADARSNALDASLLLRGLVDLLRLRAALVPLAQSGAYIALAESLREQYVLAARRTV